MSYHLIMRDISAIPYHIVVVHATFGQLSKGPYTCTANRAGWATPNC